MLHSRTFSLYFLYQTCLSGKHFVISGVLDSMTREEMTSYIVKHGGKVVKGITKTLNYLVTDVEGTVGTSKLAQCKAKGIPVVGENFVYEMVKNQVKHRN